MLQIRIRIKLKSRIRILINVKFRSCGGSAQRRVCRPVVANSHHFDEKLDPDPHQRQKPNRIRIFMKVTRRIQIKVRRGIRIRIPPLVRPTDKCRIMHLQIVVAKRLSHQTFIVAKAMICSELKKILDRRPALAHRKALKMGFSTICSTVLSGFLFHVKSSKRTSQYPASRI